MKRRFTWQRISLVLVLSSCALLHPGLAQPEYLGLAGQQITALDINFGIVAVGTDRNGVHWQYAGSVTDSGWSQIALDSWIQTVYPHKSGPIGWAISAGIVPPDGQPPYVLCSYTGGPFEANSDGIDPSTASGVHALDGFPDPSVCGETYAVTNRVLYRRYYGDTLWQPVFNATVEGNLETVKVRQQFPGVVLVGGADGFAGILLAKSTDFGETWKDISPFGVTLAVDFTGAEADTIFVAAFDRIFRSADGGTNWTTVYQDGISFRLTEILYRVHANIVYAGGSTLPDNRALLLVSHDFGDSWQQVPLPGLGALVGLEANGDHVYFATRDEGVYRLEDIISDTNEPGQTSRARSLGLQVFPNPATDRATIDFHLMTPADVTLRVSDASGRVIHSLHDHGMSAGPHSITWDVSDTPAGVYAVTLTSGQIHASAQVVVSGE